MASRNGSDSISPTVPPISDDHHVDLRTVGPRRNAPHRRLYFVGDVRDHLHGLAQIIAAALA